MAGLWADMTVGQTENLLVGSRVAATAEMKADLKAAYLVEWMGMSSAACWAALMAEMKADGLVVQKELRKAAVTVVQRAGCLAADLVAHWAEQRADTKAKRSVDSMAALMVGWMAVLKVVRLVVTLAVKLAACLVDDSAGR